MNDDNKFYYYLKAGYSNCLLNMGRTAREPNTAYMWIGYQYMSFDTLTKDLSKDGVHFTRKDKDIPTDTLNLFTMSQATYKEQVRVITFSNKLFEVWEFIEGLTQMNPTVRSCIMNNIRQSPEDIQKWILGCFPMDTKQKTKKNIKHSDRLNDFEKRFVGEHSRFVKLKRVFHCNRTELPPPINSLSVYQGFSRGTFRPIASADSGKEEALTPILQHSNLIKTNTYTGNSYTERRFGHFIRKYISFLADPTSKDFYNYMGLDDTSGLQLILNTLNPGQMETAAMLLILDLGFVPEIGTAHALDSIDVRGRLPEKISPLQILQKIKLLNLPMNKAIEEKLIGERVLEIQCKAYQPNSVSREDIVFFTPSIRSNVPTAIHWSLEQIRSHLSCREYLKKSEDWYLLNNWLLNIKEGFSRKPQTFKVKSAA